MTLILYNSSINNKLISRDLRFKSSQVTFIYIALLTIQIVSKHLTVSSWRIECQQCIIIRLDTQFSFKGISLLNSEMSLSS